MEGWSFVAGVILQFEKRKAKLLSLKKSTVTGAVGISDEAQCFQLKQRNLTHGSVLVDTARLEDCCRLIAQEGCICPANATPFLTTMLDCSKPRQIAALFHLEPASPSELSGDFPHRKAIVTPAPKMPPLPHRLLSP